MDNKTTDWQGPSFKEFFKLITDNIVIFIVSVLVIVTASFLLLPRVEPISYEGKVRISITPFVNMLNSAKNTNAKLRKTNATLGVQLRPSFDSVENALNLIGLTESGKSDKVSEFIDRDPATLLKSIAITSAGSNNYDISFKFDDAGLTEMFLLSYIDAIEDELNQSIHTQLMGEIEGLEQFLDYEKQNLRKLQSTLKNFSLDSGYLTHSVSQSSYEYAVQLLNLMIPTDFVEFAKNTSRDEYVENLMLTGALSEELILQYQHTVRNQLLNEIATNTSIEAKKNIVDLANSAQDLSNQILNQVVYNCQNNLKAFGYDSSEIDTILTIVRYYSLLEEKGNFETLLEEFVELKRVFGVYNKQYIDQNDIITEYERQIQYLGLLLDADDLKIERVGAMSVKANTSGVAQQVIFLASIFFALGVGVVVVMAVDALRPKIHDVKTVKRLINTSIPPIYELMNNGHGEEFRVEVLANNPRKRTGVFVRLTGTIVSNKTEESNNNYAYLSLNNGANTASELINICYALSINDTKTTLIDPVNSKNDYINLVSRSDSSSTGLGNEITFTTFGKEISSNGKDTRITVVLCDSENIDSTGYQGLNEAIASLKRPIADSEYQVVNTSNYHNYDSLLHLLKNTNGVIISLQRKKVERLLFSDLVSVIRKHDIPIIGILLQE